MLYADDLELLAESREQVLEKVKLWKKEMEEKGLRVNMEKTKMMQCRVRPGQCEDSGVAMWCLS